MTELGEDTRAIQGKQRKEDVLRHLAIAKAILELNPGACQFYGESGMVEELRVMIECVNGEFYGNFCPR